MAGFLSKLLTLGEGKQLKHYEATALRHARRIGGACVPDPPLRLAPRLACPVNFL